MFRFALAIFTAVQYVSSIDCHSSKQQFDNEAATIERSMDDYNGVVNETLRTSDRSTLANRILMASNGLISTESHDFPDSSSVSL